MYFNKSIFPLLILTFNSSQPTINVFVKKFSKNIFFIRYGNHSLVVNNLLRTLCFWRQYWSFQHEIRRIRWYFVLINVTVSVIGRC
jgi:hypothetical protein